MIWRYLRWFHNRTRETYVPSRATIARPRGLGLRAAGALAAGRRRRRSSGPTGPAGSEVRRALGWSPDDVVIGYVSRIAAEKNVDYLADALAIVAARRPGCPVPVRRRRPGAGEPGAPDGPIARFVGYRTGEDLADHYAAADLFAFASLTETFGNVVLEAMASGLPVVALRAGGVGEIVRSGETGLLVEPSEPPERLADALLSLVDRPDERRRMAAGRPAIRR